MKLTAVAPTGLIVALALLALGGSACAEEALPLVALRAQVVLATPELLLGQLSDITAPAELAARLAVVSLGSGAVPGSQRVITAGYLRLRLRGHGLDPGRLEIRGEQVLVLHPATATPSPTSPVAAPDATDTPAASVIQRGQLVEVSVQCGAVSIHCAGRALCAAGPGEPVRIALEGNSRTLLAWATGPGRAVCLITRNSP